MQTHMTAPGELEIAGTDLGPLAWVLDELRKSLDGATKALRRFVRDAELARGSDLAELDASQLRIARQQLHQAVGALEMVGLGAPAKVLRVMEALAQKFVQRPELCSDDAANKVERASFALTEYLEGVLKGKNASPVALFPQYRDVLDLVGGDRIHPADLWPVQWHWHPVPVPAETPALAYGPAVRSRVDQAVLKVVRTGDVQGTHIMTDISLGLAAAADAPEPQVFWALAAGFFEAVGLGLCPQDVYVKRTASRIIAQYTTLAKGDVAVVDRLAQDLLFYCAQAVPAEGASAHALQAVRGAYGLVQTHAVDYATPQFGRFDPALLAQARKRIASATETWAALAGGDTNRLKAAADQFAGVADAMVKLHPESGDLARALVRATEATLRSGEPPTASVAMEVATAVLYLEAAYDDLDPTESKMAERSARLAQRLEHVTTGSQPGALETWMEELYRRVSDRQTMGSVVDELRGTLGLVEKSLDQFFRNPQDRVPLHEVPSQLAQMRGVFSVLGLDQASLAALRMRDSVEKFLVDDIGSRGSATAVFEKIGNSLGAMGFLIDMLSYQRALAKKLFVYDEQAGELRPVMGRDKAARVSAPPVQAEVVQAEAPVATEVRAPATAPATAPAPAGEAALAAPLVVEPVATAPVMPAAAAMELDDEDAEMRDIFLEEAREVVHNGMQALQALRVNPADMGEGTTLRRAFHTLKGSARMVGLGEFGDAAWAMEQLANTWLAEQKPASSELLSLAGDAIEQFSHWVEDIATGAVTPWSALTFRKAADALREENTRIPLPWPGTPALVEAIELPGGALGAPEAKASESQERESVAPVQATPGLSLELSPPAETPPAPEITFEFDIEGGTDAREQPVAAPEMPVRGAFEATQMFELPDFAPQPVAESPPAAPRVDFESTQMFEASAQTALPEVAAVPELAQATDLSDLTGVPEAPDARRPDFAATQAFDSADIAPAAATQPASLDFEDIDFGDLAPVGAANVDAPGSDGVTTAHARPGEAPEVITALEEAVTEPAPLAELRAEQLAADEPAQDDEDQIKVIGDLRIGIPLYNVYLNEADEWSRHLLTELSEWELELDKPLRDSTVGLAHSLAGSSGTVGFMALSEIARALEHALQHVQLHGQSRPEHARVFNLAAEEIRRLLHQFAAGFLKQPDPAIHQALRDILETAFPPAEDALDEPLSFDALDTVQPDAAAETLRGVPVSEPATFAAAVAVAPPTWPDSEESDVTDMLDPDLFPVFEEEAADLFPQLGGALRQWAARPDNLGARREALRVLHTLKGSARLAGAMRLGEMAHRLESAIESLGSEDVMAGQVEPMLARFDVLQSVFDGLRKMSQQGAPAVAQPAATAPRSDALAVAQVVPDRRSRSRSRSASTLAPARQSAQQSVRVSAALLDRLVNQAGEVIITRSRLDGHLGHLRSSLKELGGNLDRLRQQLREIEVQSESQMQSRMAQAKDHAQDFDPLEFDRFTRVQELTRIMAESVADVATVQRNLQRTMESTEDDLIAQARQARELQRDLLRTRMVEFDGIAERLYGVVRQASKEVGKQVKLDIVGGSMDLDRSVLERMTPAFEHMLRNAVAHGIEEPHVRAAAGKPAVGSITIELSQEGNDVSVDFSDDGGGLDVQRIRDSAIRQGLLQPAAEPGPDEVANLIFAPGFSTAERVTELSGRGVGLDVVRNEVNALGGRIETSTTPGQGTTFRLVVPLTTAVTQVVMLRLGELAVGVPSNLVEVVKRVTASEVEQAYASNTFSHGGQQIPFFWAGALLESSALSAEPAQKHLPVVVFRSAGRQVALHVDEVLGNQEVVVKNLGPQLARVPGMAGMSVLASGAVVLIYNPVALANIYGDKTRQMQLDARTVAATPSTFGGAATAPLAPALGAVQTPLILVVDDSITVRRVTQRLLKREGYRVVLAADGLQALERLQDELPAVVLSDIEMPRMDGFDLARNIRSDVRLRDLPIIMITSRIAEKHREHARELGVDHYLGKPYSEEELLGLVRHYCALPVAEGNTA